MKKFAFAMFAAALALSGEAKANGYGSFAVAAPVCSNGAFAIANVGYAVPTNAVFASPFSFSSYGSSFAVPFRAVAFRSVVLAPTVAFNAVAVRGAVASSGGAAASSGSAAASGGRSAAKTVERRGLFGRSTKRSVAISQ